MTPPGTRFRSPLHVILPETAQTTSMPTAISTVLHGIKIVANRKHYTVMSIAHPLSRLIVHCKNYH